MLLIGNGKVITRDAACPYIPDGAVVTDGEAIREVGSLEAMKAKYAEAEFVDAGSLIIYFHIAEIVFASEIAQHAAT